jgi:hypothetical protein
MDVHVPVAVTYGLLLRGVDVLTAQLDGTTEMEDPALLDRATTLGRVLVTQDEDLLAEAAHRQRNGCETGSGLAVLSTHISLILLLGNLLMNSNFWQWLVICRSIKIGSSSSLCDFVDSFKR